MTSLAEFRITVAPLEDACLMRVTGEIDSITADRLRAQLDAARADRITTLLDLSAVGSVGPAGLHVLLNAARAANEDTWAWFIVRPSAAVLSLLEASGTALALPLVALPEAGPTLRPRRFAASG